MEGRGGRGAGRVEWSMGWLEGGEGRKERGGGK